MGSFTCQCIMVHFRVCNLVIFLNQTPIFDWCVVKWGSKNIKYKTTCLKEIGLYVKILLNYSQLNIEHDWGEGIYCVKKSTNMHFQ